MTKLASALAGASLAFAGSALAGDMSRPGEAGLNVVMHSEIQTAWTGLQKATESIGCLITATGTNEVALSGILDRLNKGEMSLRNARRIAESASNDDERNRAIEHARASLAHIWRAEADLEKAGLN